MRARPRLCAVGWIKVLGEWIKVLESWRGKRLDTAVATHLSARRATLICYRLHTKLPAQLLASPKTN